MIAAVVRFGAAVVKATIVPPEYEAEFQRRVLESPGTYPVTIRMFDPQEVETK